MAALLLSAILMAPAGAAPANAAADAESGEDRVWYALPTRERSTETWLPQPLRVATGTITEFDRRQLRIEGNEEGISFIPAERVVRFSVRWPEEPAGEAFAAYRREEYGEAIPGFLAAVQQQPPAWRQRLLVAHMMSAAMAAGRSAAALELVRQWSAAQPPATLYGFLPVAWSSAPLPADAQEAARGRLADAAPEVRLVAASWLLAGPEGGTARSVLQTLASDPQHPEIARLADAVRWRHTPPPEVAASLPEWRDRIGRLPIPLQAGPLVTVADRLMMAGSAEQSLEFWLSVALLHADVVPLAAEARQNAAALLKQLGREDEASRLIGER